MQSVELVMGLFFALTENCDVRAQPVDNSVLQPLDLERNSNTQWPPNLNRNTESYGELQCVLRDLITITIFCAVC